MTPPLARLEQTRPSAKIREARADDDRNLRRLVNPREALSRFALLRRDPAPDLAHLIDNHWIVRWDLRGLPPHDQSVLPQPSMNLVFEGERWVLHGVETTIRPRRIEGAGRIFGVKFHPGAGFLAGLRPAAAWADRSCPWSELVPEALEADQACAHADDDERQERVEALLRRHAAPPEGTPLAAVRALIGLAEATPQLLRVEDWAERGGVSVRQLQRWFRDCVGVSPKWLLRHLRIHEGAGRIARGDPAPMADLAYSLGYSDQAHFSRDFTAVVGQTPARYAAACRSA